MTRVQEMLHRTTQGALFKLVIEEVPLVEPAQPKEVKYCFHFSGVMVAAEGARTYFKHPKDKVKPLAEQYEEILKAWLQTLAEKGDSLTEVDNGATCELFSLQQQQQVRAALNADYAIKANGTVV
ncbi:hypothetical protein DES53_102982 [Roseimicrobium gellanilyticum]|uniref:Uncharacterized protein n=1 Tax=Roseimicrobium gellanilyticum TaxID=748857 RepID=A0A366HSC7_9BACT|nr:hypothetical protein [Roseimicrobium gellanilyticum]RBP46590.1 hypothetical protein DES53_102982 [Roseimicrobium gellanilyticum]